MNINVIDRFGEPSKIDTAPHGYICKVHNNSTKNSVDLYIQISHNEDEPNWNYLGNFHQDISHEEISNLISKFQ